MKCNNFVYELVVKAPKNSAKTNQALYGGDGTFVNMDFGIDIHAREQVCMMFQDAIGHCLHLQLHCGVNMKETVLYKHLQRKIELYERLRDSMKMVRIE